MSTRRRVAMATWYPADRAKPRGGVEAVSVVLAHALAERGDWEVHVVTLGLAEDVRREAEHLTIHTFPRTGRSLLQFTRKEGRSLMAQAIAAIKPDILHAHDTFGLMTTGLRLPRAMTIHGFIHEDTRYKGGVIARLRAQMWKKAELETWARYPHIISICPYVRERLRGIATGMIHDIENPVAKELFSPANNEGKCHIFSAAVIGPRKNTLGLLEAFARINLPGCRLRLAGPVVDPAYGVRLRDRIAALGVSDRVDLLGSISTAEIRRELSGASVFALVSLEEGAPMGVAEALSMGVPVVTSNRCGMPYMVRDGESGALVDPNDSAAIARKLHFILSSQERRNAMSKYARDFAEQHYHPTRVAARTVRVYEEAGDK